MRDLAPDVLVVAAFGQIIPQRLLDLPPYGGINVHGSLLPRWRGAAPMQYALMAGDAETGVTTMQMDAGLDTGDILLQASLPLTDDDNLGTLEAAAVPTRRAAAAGDTGPAGVGRLPAHRRRTKRWSPSPPPCPPTSARWTGPARRATCTTWCAASPPAPARTRTGRASA